MSDYQIFHNPRCSKSRQTLALLQEQGIEPEQMLYLQNPLTQEVVNSLLLKLAVPVRDIIRNSEDAYKTLGLADTSLSDDALVQALVDNPKLLQRPIVVKGDKAIIGRPPENVLALINE